MSTEYKVLEDVMPMAEEVLAETAELIDQVFNAAQWLRSFGKEQKEQYGTLPQYLAQSVAGLKSACIAGFDINYPALSRVVANGQNGDEGMRRLHDGLYRLGQFHNTLAEHKYLVKFDEEREELYKQAKQIVGDLAIFVITQYKLYEDSGHYMSVVSYCEKHGVSPSVFYGDMLIKMEWADAEPYGYELISEWRQPLTDVDPVFVAECEEHGFPLTSALAKQIVDGTLPVAEARDLLAQFLQQSEETTVEGMTPANMISKMNLS